MIIMIMIRITAGLIMMNTITMITDGTITKTGLTTCGWSSVTTASSSLTNSVTATGSDIGTGATITTTPF